MITEQLKRLAKNTFIYGIGQVLNRFIQFFLLPLFTTYLSPTDYGIISILGLIIFVVTPLFSLGLGAAVGPCYFEKSQQERKEATIWTAFAIMILTVFILVIFGTVYSDKISVLALRTIKYSYLVRLTFWNAGFSIAAIPLALYLQFEERAKMFVSITIVSTLISITLSVAMVVIFGRGVYGVVEGSCIGQGVSFFIFLIVVAPSISFRIKRDLARDMLRFGIPLIPGFAFLFILQHANRYILQLTDGLASVGIYTIGCNIGMIMSLMVSGFTYAWYPYFMSFMDRQDEARILFGRVFTYYTFIFGSLSLLFYTIAKPVVSLMTQPAFHQASEVVGLSASAQFLIGIFSLLLPGIYFAKDVKYISLIQAIAAIASIGLNIMLIHLFDFFGAAISLMLGILLMVILAQIWNFFRRQDYIEIQFEWKRIIYFSFFYMSYMILMLWKTCFPFQAEMIISFMATILLPVIIYFFLNAKERAYITSILKQLKISWDKFSP